MTMSRVVPLYPRSAVDRAGNMLVNIESFPVHRQLQLIDESVAVINNWRSSHRYPLNAIQVAVRQRALQVDPHAVIPQRLKRMPAIENKLRLQSGMQLSRMHDIGGCRAIVADVASVRRVVELCQAAAAKNSQRRAKLAKKYDYLDGDSPGPKPDGYRGVHLVYQYRSDSEALKVFNGLKIEVQVRSRLQHAFATAVETASIFTKQPIKSIRANLDDVRWRYFFALMGNAFAVREDTTPIPGVPHEKTQLADEISKLATELAVETVLSGWGDTVEQLSGQRLNARTFLLLLDAEAKTTSVIGYTQQDAPKTDEEYLRIEKQFKGSESQQVVWVSAESIEALRIGYPNFYLDTRAFLAAMNQAIAGL